MEFPPPMPYPMSMAIVFAFGLILGSFSNVCIYRMPRKESVVLPGSHCTGCNTPIRALDNIPVLSYLFLGGKCRNCKEPISIIYPAIELVTALLLTAVYIQFGFTWEALIYGVVCFFLVIVAVIDLKHQIIPDKITLPGIVFGFAAGYYLTGGIWDSLFGFLLGGGLFYLLAVLSRGGMGGGDIKFIAAAGALLGWQKVLLVIFSGAILGSVIGLALMALKKKGRKSLIPFGPFLAVGVLIAIFWGDDLVRMYLNFSGLGQ